MKIQRIARALKGTKSTTTTVIVGLFVATALMASLPAIAQETGPSPSPSGSPDGRHESNRPTCPQQEIESLRTRDSKTFQNANCSYTATFEEYTHYEAEPGRWKTTDLRFEEQGPDWVSDDHDVVVTVAGATVTAVDRKTGQGVRWVIPGEPRISGRRATFSFEGLEWSYVTTKPGLKLGAMVSASRGPQTYTFPYALVGGAPDFTVDEEGNLMSGGFAVPRAFALGADGESYRADPWELLPGNRIAFSFDDTKLPTDAYPYELDPTTNFYISSSENSGGVWSNWDYYPPSCAGSGTTPRWGSAQIAVERTRWTDDVNPNHLLSNGLLRWDTSWLPDSATINSATIEVGSTGQTGNHNVRDLTADWYSAWPIDCADHTADAQTSALGGIPLKALIDDYVVDSYVTIPLDNAFGVSKSGFTGVRFHISGGQFFSYESNMFTFHGYGSTDVNAPRLIITYDNATPNLYSATDSPDPVTPGSQVTFTTGWSDANGEPAKSVICKTNAVSNGSCPGGSWAIGNLTYSSPSSATYTTSTSDFGTRNYYAFVCDSVGGCSPSIWGTFTVNNAPSISSASDSPDPIGAGLPVTFSVGWSDPNAGDSVRAVICKTNSVSGGSCPGGSWAIGSPKSTSQSTATYTTWTSDFGTKSYYAFACDSVGACSPSLAGTFTVNNPPTISSVSDTPDPVTSGSPVTFSVAWNDANQGDNVKAVICKTNSISAGGCPGGSWTTGSPRSVSPSTATYTPSPSDVGTRTYYAFVCDSTNACSPSLSGTFTVQNAAPRISSASDSPDPVRVGSVVTFTVGWSDPGDSAKAVVCKTNSISSGTCPGGAWASAALSSSTPSSATYTTQPADVGVRSYYAFACDAANACSSSISGTFRVDGTPGILSVSDAPDPVVAGSPVTFTVGWSDPGDAVKALICKANYVYPSSTTCYAGAWATGNLSSSSPSTATYTTRQADVGTHTYYAFACDAASACSPSMSGSFTVNNRTPALTSASDSPDPTESGQTITFSVGWSDTQGDSVKAMVCETDEISMGACSDGTWATGSPSTTSPATASYTTSSSDDGTNDYFAFACDTRGACSAAAHRGFEVRDQLMRSLDQISTCADGPDEAEDPDGEIGEGRLLIGTQADDQIWGTPSADIIFGRGGEDAIKGLGGNDTICGGPGHDGINGNGDPQAPDPLLDDDTIEGENGRDFIVSADGNDSVLGGDDIDIIYGGPGVDTLSGGVTPTPEDPTGDDLVPDYVAGGDGADVITVGASEDDPDPDPDRDETYEDIEPDKECAVERHRRDADFHIAKAGTWAPGRLVVNHASRPCLELTGKVIDMRTEPNDGDAKFFIPRERPPPTAGAQLIIEVTETVQNPDPCRETRIAKGDQVRVEFMPRDFGADLNGDDAPDHFPLPKNQDIVTVEGLCVNDVNPGHEEDDDEIHTEIHPTYYVRYNGDDYFSGKKRAGSPIKMHPCSLRKLDPQRPKCGRVINTPRNPIVFFKRHHRYDWRYCWDENGNPCRAWDPSERSSFG